MLFVLFDIVVVRLRSSKIAQLSASNNSSTELVYVSNVSGNSSGGDSATRQARAIMDYSPTGSSEIELRMNEARV